MNRKKIRLQLFAEPKEFKTPGVVIGVENAVFAKVTKDDATGITYGEVISAPGLVEVGVKYNVTDEAIPADNNPTYDQAKSLDTVDVTVTMNSIGKEGQVFLLGRKVDAKGIMSIGADDIAPDVAMGYKTLRKDGSYDYVWLLKGQFKPTDTTVRTREKGKINWQQPQLGATFGQRIHDNQIQLVINTKDEDADPATLTSFFTAVPALTPKTP